MAGARFLTTTPRVSADRRARQCGLQPVPHQFHSAAPLDCYTCHSDKWLSTVALALTDSSVPNHLTAGFVTATCASCHTTSSWLGAVFNHSATRFPLTGAHHTVACNLCHLSSTPPPLDCASCHNAQWPEHRNVGWVGTKSPRRRRRRRRNPPNHMRVVPQHDKLAGSDVYSLLVNVNHGNAGEVCLTCHLNSLSAGRDLHGLPMYRLPWGTMSRPDSGTRTSMGM